MSSLSSIFLTLAVASCGAATVEAVPSQLRLEDRLALSPLQAASGSQDEQAVPRVLPEQPPEAVAPVADVSAPKPGDPVTRVQGVNLANFKNDVVALAYRGSSGLGLGLASTGGLALTGGYATEGGMRVNLYYVHTFPELSEDAARAAGFELTSELPERSVGITIGWKF